MVTGRERGVVIYFHRDLGFPAYTAAWVGGKKSMVDVFAITLALMFRD